MITSHERFHKMYAHQECDRVPIIDSPWNATIKRWQNEGMPVDTNFADFFDLDLVTTINVDNSPRYEERILEETPEHKIHTSKFGVTMKQWKHAASTPEFIDFTIISPETWKLAKERMTPSRDRINWDHLESNYPIWKQKGYWIQAGLWFGFDVTHSWVVGTERVLLALIENPGWLMDIFEQMLELNLALLEEVWDAGYHFDCITWPDDMGYKHNQFFSLKMYRRILKPFHQRAIDWAHARGIKAHLHSCGDINPFVPELISMGLDGLNPLEVKAGMDPLYLKQTYGKDLVLHGGINAVLWDQPEKIYAEIERVLPLMKVGGGYIFSSDHSVPSNVSLEDFRNIIALAKQLGSYS
ncbi:MAG TPA: uroporphyrinogen decarboxylase family protein [Anaerolineaceae bacterium]